MQLGIHAYAWCSEWSNNTLDILDTAKREGLDFLEIPLMKLEDFDPAAVRRRKDDVGIDVVTSNVILADEHDITSRNPEYRKNGIEYLKRCVDATAEVEGKCFSGVIYSQYCKADALPTEDDWKWSAEGLRAVGEHAQQYGITIGMEPVTRYESNLINTCEQALRLADRIGLDNVMVHLDSYHMNVEEKSFYEATRLAKGRLCHYHMCECDRGIPGTGHVDWDGIFRALKENDYHGRIGMEGFSDITDNMSTWVWRKLAKGRLCHYHMCECDRGIPGTGHVDWDGIFRALKENDYHGRIGMEGFSDITDNMSTWVWRKLAPSGDVFLREGVRFLRRKIEEYGL